MTLVVTSIVVHFIEQMGEWIMVRLVALGAAIASSTQLVYGASPELVLLRGDSVIGSGSIGVEEIGTSLLNATGDVAAAATVGGVPVVLSSVAGWRLVAFQGMPLPQGMNGAIGSISSSSVSLDDFGRASFIGGVTGRKPSAVGVFAELGGDLLTVALDSERAPSSPSGTYAMTVSVPFRFSRDGRLAFIGAFVADSSNQSLNAVFSGAVGSVVQHAREDQLPGDTGFVSFERPLINSTGHVCLVAETSTSLSSKGVFSGPAGALHAIATTESPVPDRHGVPISAAAKFVGFGSVGMNAENSVVFVANISNAIANQGLWFHDAMGTRLIALGTDAVPGLTGVSYGSFGNVALCDNGDVVFASRLAGKGVNGSASRAIFRCRRGSIGMIARELDPCPGIAGATYLLHPTFAANAVGQVVMTGVTSGSIGEDIVLLAQPNNELSLVHRETLNLTFRGGQVRRFGNFDGLRNSGGNDGVQRSLNDKGQLALTGMVNIPPGVPFEPTGQGIVVFSLGAWCPADLNSDGFVDDADFSIFAAAYNILDCADPMMAPGCPADLNLDGLVDDSDFSVFAVAYDVLLCP